VDEKKTQELKKHGWTDEDIKALIEAENEEREAGEALATAQAEYKSWLGSPEVVIAQKRIDAQRKREEQALIDDAKEADKVYLAAVKERGEHFVRKLPTKRCTIVMRAQTMLEMEETQERMKSIPDSAIIPLALERTLNLVLYPSREVVKKACDEFPGLLSRLFNLRDELSSAVVEDHEKKA